MTELPITHAIRKIDAIKKLIADYNECGNDHYNECEHSDACDIIFQIKIHVGLAFGLLKEVSP